MSKSKVKDPKANPNGPRPATTSVRAVLQRGEQINKTRCRTSPASIDVPCRSSKQNPKFKDVTVCKILWPHETKYPACSHGNDLILNRFAMSQKTHCSLLALPKKTIFRPAPRWIERKIYPISTRVNYLAQPNPIRVINNFDAHLNHLSIFQVENFLKQIARGDYTTPKEAIQFMERSLQDHRNKLCRQRKERKQLKAKLVKKQAESLKEIARQALFSLLMPALQETESYELSEEVALCSKFVLIKICQLLKQNVPHLDSTTLEERILIRIADKVALTVAEFIKESGFHNPPAFNIKVCKDFSKKCQPIEELLPVDKSDGSPTDEDEKSIDEKDEEIDAHPNKSPKKLSIVGSVERKLSFLRKSQIDFSGINCGQEQAAADAERAQKNANKASKADAKAKRKQDRDRAKKAKANAAKKKAGQDDGNECLGNVNKKPQWQIEWVDRG